MIRYGFTKEMDIPYGTAIDPIASMKAIDNPELRKITETIGQRLKMVIQNA